MPFGYTPLAELPDAILIEPVLFRDDRGWFAEVFKESELAAHGLPARFTQENQMHFGRRGVLRGLHYQNPPNAQGKLVRCVLGEVFDVAVDLRRGSPTYGRWRGVLLSPEVPRMLWIPVGFAHGAQSLSDVADVLYKVTADYAPASARSIRWDDPSIAIEWPLPDPVLSPRDRDAPLLADADNDLVWSPG